MPPNVCHVLFYQYWFDSIEIYYNIFLVTSCYIVSANRLDAGFVAQISTSLAFPLRQTILLPFKVFQVIIMYIVPLILKVGQKCFWEQSQSNCSSCSQILKHFVRMVTGEETWVQVGLLFKSLREKNWKYYSAN